MTPKERRAQACLIALRILAKGALAGIARMGLATNGTQVTRVGR